MIFTDIEICTMRSRTDMKKYTEKNPKLKKMLDIFKLNDVRGTTEEEIKEEIKSKVDDVVNASLPLILREGDISIMNQLVKVYGVGSNPDKVIVEVIDCVLLDMVLDHLTEYFLCISRRVDMYSEDYYNLGLLSELNWVEPKGDEPKHVSATSYPPLVSLRRNRVDHISKII